MKSSPTLPTPEVNYAKFEIVYPARYVIFLES